MGGGGPTRRPALVKPRPGGSKPRGGRRQEPSTRTTRLPESVAVVTIDRIAAGGDGVGRVNGMVLFVPRTAPGDVVQSAYVTHARHGRGRVLQVVQASPDRVEPACPHYVADRCGGCQLQHLSAEAQRAARQQIVQETLRRIGKREVPLPPLVSDVQWHYRSRLTLTLLPRGAGWVGGLHPYDDASRVFPLETCHIAHPTLVEVWNALRLLVRNNVPALPVPSVAPSLRLGLRLAAGEAAGVGGAGEGVVLVIEGGSEWPSRDEWTAAARKAHPAVRGVWWTPERVAPNGTPRSSPGVDSSMAPVEAYAPDGREALAFAQVNETVARALREFVYAQVTGFVPAQVIDGYAGTGDLSLRLALDGVEVVAIEADPAGSESASRKMQEAGGTVAARVRVVCDLMERALPSLDKGAGRADVVVLNPPRRGVHADVTAWLESPASRGVRGVVYVSCDPATLARDLARLPSWRVETVQCFDMFPQTAHVETVCVLHRSASQEER